MIMQLAEMVSQLETQTRELYRTDIPTIEQKANILAVVNQIVLETHRIETRIRLMLEGV